MYGDKKKVKNLAIDLYEKEILNTYANIKLLCTKATGFLE